jgi:predicted outer membrane repeat protein
MSTMKKQKAIYLIPLLLLLSILGKAQTTRTVPGQYSSIQAAVNAANWGDTIKLTGTIKEVGIRINKSITIIGSHPDSSIIDGDTNGVGYTNRQIFIIERNHYLYPPILSVIVTIKKLTIKNGESANPSQFSSRDYSMGGAIRNYGVLNIENVHFINNQSGETSGGNGGAIYNQNTLNIENCYFENNQSYNCHCVCFYMYPNNCPKYQNGGAIYNEYNAIANISNTVFFKNDAFEGGAIFNKGYVDIKRCTFKKNTSNDGGAIYNSKDSKIVNSTFFKNIAPNQSGIILNNGNLTLENCTISKNNYETTSIGHGIYNSGGLKIKNSIISKNGGHDIYNSNNGIITSCGFNLIQSPGNVIFNSIGDTTGVDAKLDSLRYNGGFTPTCALLPGSPAIGQGHNVDIDGNQVLTDQRGYYRPNPPDIGAFQSNICMATAYQEEITACTGTLDFNAMTVEIMDTNQVQTQNLYQYSFSLDSTTNPNDVVKAYLVFDNKLIGDTVFQPNDTFSFSDRFTLNKGINTFHLIYQVSYNAFPGNYLDAACLSIKKDSQNIVTGVTHPLRKTYIQMQPSINVQPIGKYVCYGDSNAIFVSTNNPSFQNFQWYRNNKKIDGANDTILHLKNISSSDNYFVKVTNSCTSVFSDTVKIKLSKPAKPTITIYGDKFLCPGQLAVLEANGGDSFLWSNNEFGKYVTIDTTSKIQVQTFDSLGCISDKSNKIEIKKIDYIPKPVLDSVFQTEFCDGESITLKCTSEFDNYLWSNNSNNKNIKVSKTGSYSIIGRNNYTFKNKNYVCESEPSDTIEITFHKNPEKPKINVNGKTELCWEETTILEAPLGYSKYFWSGTEGLEYLQVSSAGKFALIVEDSNQCQSHVSDTIEIKVFPLPEAPTVEIDEDSAFCEGGKTLLKTTTYPAYKWNTGDTTQNLEVTEKGYYSVSIFDSNNCQSGFSNTVFIDVFPKPEKPVLNYSGLVEICDGDSIELHAIKNEYKYLWNKKDTISKLSIKSNGKFNLQVFQRTQLRK